MARGDVGEGLRPRRQRFQRRQRGLELRDQSGGGVELGIAERGARIGAMQRRRFLAVEFRQARRGRSCSACASPAVPRFGRGPRRIARSSVATARASSRHSGCLSSASSVTGAQAFERGLGGEPREHAGRRVGQRIAAGIVDRHVPARQRRQHAARQRAVGRHQRCGLVRRRPPPRAAPPRSPAPPPRRWRPRSRRWL